MALGARQQVKIWKTGQLSRHYIAEISLNVTLNHNQPTNHMMTPSRLTYNNGSSHNSFWYFTYELIMTQGGPLLNLGSKGQGQIQTLNYAKFTHNNSIIFWHTMMILDACVAYDARRYPIDFGVKGQGQTWKNLNLLRWGYLSLLGQVLFYQTWHKCSPRGDDELYWYFRSKVKFTKDKSWITLQTQ